MKTTLKELYHGPQRLPGNLSGNVVLILRSSRFSFWRMKSKQLANVLIKIVGLYVCLCAIPGIFVGILFIVLKASGGLKTDQTFDYEMSSSLSTVIQFVVGIFLIGKSRKLSEFWFKNEEE